MTGITTTHSERDPLLGSSSLNSQDEWTKSKLGPLEIPRSTRYGILAGVWTSTFLSSLNMTLVATLLAGISSDFQKSQQAGWLGTSYLLATCTFTPLYGRLCNVMGRRGANQTAVFFAALGTALCGFSNNMETLIAARFLAGMGGGGITTTATCDHIERYTRGLAQGVGSVFNSLGMGLGGPLGGFISDRFGWRWAFLIQIPLFGVSFALTSINLHYVTPGKSKSTLEVLKRIDYLGSATLLSTVLSCLIFLSTKYNDDNPWSTPIVFLSLTFSIVSFILFVVIELFIAPEPVLPPFLLKKKIPVLVAVSSFLVAMCNFSVMYNFPTWFQTVLLTSAAEAGAHLIPNGVSISLGSLFAGYIMHITGRYKTLNLVFGLFPFVAAILLSLMKETSPQVQLWLSILPLGFGNAVVLQTVHIALLAHLPQDAIAVGTGFNVLFRGIGWYFIFPNVTVLPHAIAHTGQVGGVAVSSALFQSLLDSELHKRIQREDAEAIISEIRHSTTLVAKLPPDLQRAARDSYAASLRAVFILAACMTFLAYVVRLPIPDKSLDHVPRRRSISVDPQVVERSPSPINPLEETEDIEEDSVVEEADIQETNENDEVPNIRPRMHHGRRLSTYASSDGGVDLESDIIGGSARR
ncbi:MFS general substrate transporter [Abortiporus biennis]|nr:MFS general substrate transporter [Abortiporus biennis]